MGLRSARGAMSRQEGHYMRELKRALDKASVKKEVEIGIGGRVLVPLYEYEKMEDEPWYVEDVDRDPQGEEIWVWMMNEEGYEEAEVVIHLPTDTITSAEVQQITRIKGEWK